MPLGRLSVEKAFSPEERQDAYALLMAAAHVGGANGGAAWASSCGSCRCGGAWCCGVGGALNSGCGGGGTYPCAGYHSGGGAANATVAVSPHMPAQNLRTRILRGVELRGRRHTSSHRSHHCLNC